MIKKGGQPHQHRHIFRQCKRNMHSYKMIGGKLYWELRPQDIYFNSNRIWKKLSRKSGKGDKK